MQLITAITVQLLSFYEISYTLNFKDNLGRLYHMGYNWKKGQMSILNFKSRDWGVTSLDTHKNIRQITETMSLKIIEMLET